MTVRWLPELYLGRSTGALLVDSDDCRYIWADGRIVRLVLQSSKYMCLCSGAMQYADNIIP